MQKYDTVPINYLIRYLEAAKKGGEVEISHFEFGTGMADQGKLTCWSHYQDKYGEVLSFIDSVPISQIEEYGRTLHERIAERRAKHEAWKEAQAKKWGRKLPKPINTHPALYY